MPTLLLLAPIGLPLLAALSQAAGGWRRRTTGVGLATGALLLAATAALAAEVLRSGPIRTAGGLLRVEAPTVHVAGGPVAVSSTTSEAVRWLDYR